jgi:hypothetical protein
VGSQDKKLWHANTVKMLVRQSMQNIAVNLRGPDSVKGLDRPIAPVGGVKGWSIVLGRHGKLIRVWYRPESKPSQTNTATASVGFCVSPAAKSCETRKKNYVRTVRRNSLYEPVVDCCRVHIEREQEVWGLWA